MKYRALILLLFAANAIAQSEAPAAADTADLSGGFSDDAGFSDDWGGEWQDEPAGGWMPLSGFVEGAAGSRWKEDSGVDRYGTLGEVRWRIDTGWENDKVTFLYKGDFVADAILEEFELDVRDLSLAFSPLPSLDVKLGRQVLTWGTGDLLFLNDLFPKDWVSLFAGRDDEYLKAPSNSFRATQYNDFVNVDFAWTPKFTPDDFISGERFSYFSPFSGEIIGDVPPLVVDDPSRSLSNGEFALRLFKTINSVEYALYGYYGFFKTPSEVTGPYQVSFAPMTSVGASVRRPLGSGLINFETSYYYSRDDSDGTNPQIVNSQLRFLAGYEREMARNFTVGLQYYLEHIADHAALIANSPFPEFEPPQNRNTLTLRLTYRALQEKLIWSLFTYWSPDQQDAYLRPIVTYRVNDRWTTTAGLNIFGGDDPYTFLAQFEDNSNAYVRVRYNY